MFLEKLLEKKKVLIFMSVWACFLGALPRVSFGMPVDSAQSTVQLNQQRAEDIEKVNSLLELDAVRKKLHKLGLSHAQINDRLSRLDDTALHKLALRAEKIKAGGDAATVALVIAVIALIFVSILYFTDRIIKVEPRRPIE